MVTLYDVARLAGVSTATVSRVVHGQDRVRESTRDRVREVIEQLGYVPDGAAQSLSRRRKEIVGIVCVERESMHNDIENMSLLYYDEIVRGAGAGIRGHGWSLLINYLRGQEEWDFPRLRSLTGKVDGLLMVEGVIATPLIAQLAEKVPVVVIAGSPQERALDVVAVDNRAGSAALVSHLVADHGRRRLFHVDGPPHVCDVRERRLALEQVVHAHPGCRVVGSYLGVFSVRSGVAAGETLLANRGEGLPDAVVCANDQMAIGVLQAFNRAGVRVPEEIAVVGFDDIYPGSLSDPPLTTVHQPMQLLGERACARLLDRITTPGLRQRVEVLPTELVLRASCGCPPGTATRLPTH
ncbi:MAG TPA: LacI family DNA-binding transcriptional regulator [Streptosporangiaceae bacterium]|nr:LacI family DNA-binding transcriptional regulator [Streptosporangiaceae bacterium]